MMKKILTLFVALMTTTFTFAVYLTEPKVIYFNAGAVSWWTSDNAVQRAVLDGNTNSPIIGVLDYGSVYAFTIPAGNHNTIWFERAASATAPGPYNKTDYIDIAPTYNYVSSFSQNSSTVTWETYMHPAITLKGDFNNWGDGDRISFNGSKTITFVKTLSADSYEFKIVKGENEWRSSGATIARANSGAVYDFSGNNSNNTTLIADITGDYTFTYTYATRTLTVTFPDLPAQSVVFDDLDATILKGTEVTFAATATNITNPVYSYFVKPEGGEYGSAVESYAFNAEGSYTVKVSVVGDNTSEPVVAEKNVTVYSTYTFTAGTRIYVDFTAVSNEDKGVNYPKNYEEGYEYDDNGAGTFKTIRFSNNVTWSTLSTFVKTAKGGWADLTFTVPAEGQNKIIVAADGASYTWGTYTPATVQVKFFAPRDESNNWDHVYAHSWDAAGDITSWPGVEITDSKANLWYAYDAQVGANVLFHNNAGMQTANIVNIQEAACYVPTEIDYKVTPKKVTVAADGDCKVEYYIAGSKALIGGEADFDTNSALDENNQIVFHDVPSGTYAFKINNGTWAWAIGGYDNLSDEPGCGTIATEIGTGDIGFAIDHTQDVTITYYPATQKICLGAETTKNTAYIEVDDMSVKVGRSATINATYTTDATEVQYEILTGDEYIDIVDGKVIGVAEGTATVRATVPETANYLSASDEFTVTVDPLNYCLKNNWNGCEWTWEEMTAAEGGKFRLENVVYGGSGINYNIKPDDEGAVWKGYSTIKYMDGTKAKVVAAYDTINLILDPANDTIWAEMISKDDVVYTVAGNSLALFDLGWEPTHPWNYTDMEKQENGTYLFNNMEEEANLRAGTLEIKVIKNRDYANGSWPVSGNYEYDVQRSGRYDVSIHFDPCSKAIWIDTTLLNAFNIQDFNIAGSWDSEIRAFKVGGDEDKALVTIPLAVGSYTFKLQDPNNKEYGDGQAFTRANPSEHEIVQVDGGASMTLDVDKAGDYLFTYIFETEQLVITYPAIVPDEKIAPLSGEFSIGSPVTTGRMSNKVRFARGNLQYNYAENAWYTADKQYEVLGDLNLRFGDNTYQGSIDLFSWSCESSNFGTLVSSTDGDFTGAFVDWGQKFAEDENEWFTLSRSEWEYLLAREKDSHKLWTMIAIGPDSLNGLALFPDDWEAPAGLTIKYGFYDLDNKTDYKANSYTFAQWEAMEAAGAVFIPLSGTRSGHIGFTGAVSNPLTGWYCWVDNVNGIGYYWTSTPVATNTVATLILPGWHNSKWTVPQYWSRERRRGQPVRLVTRVQREPDYTRDVNGNYGTICLPKNGEMVGATIYEAAYRDLGVSKLFFDEVIDGNMEAGKPYLYLPKDGAARLEVYYTDNAAPVEADDYNGFYGYYNMSYLDDDDERAHPRNMLVGEYLIYNNQYVRVSGNNSYLAQFRAYIIMEEMPTQGVAPAPGRRRVALGYTGTSAATGIESIQPSEISIQKMMIDGQLYILRGEKMYNANGQIVK